MAPSGKQYSGLPSDAVIIKAIKAGQTHSAFAKEHDVSPGAASSAFYRLETTADPSLEIKATDKTIGKAVVRAREQGIRWERIAARSKRTIKQVQDAYTQETGKPWQESYSGRGRRFDAMPQIPKSQAAKPAAAAGRKPGNQPAAGKASGGSKPKARTKAEREGKAKDPS